MECLPRPKIKNFFKKTAIIIASLVIVLFLALSGTYFSFSITPSLDYRLFYLKWKAPVEKNKYVLALMDVREREHLEGQFLIKRAGCMPGDELAVKGRDYFCNGTYLGKAKEKSLKGQPLENFRHSGPVPEGMVFLVGDSVDSYDSRYWGFLRIDNIKAKAVPLL